MQKRGLLKLKNLVKRREKGGVSFVLEIPSFRVDTGEFVGIVGPSGCGKSTFLDILGLILTIDRADEFTLRISDDELFHLDKLRDSDLARIRRNHIGYILQSGGLLPFLTVRENILLSGRFNNREIPEAYFRSLVKQLGIEAQIDKKPQYLSGGQRQRVAIARAVIEKPALILADEPTASVDRPTALEIRDQFRELAQENNLTVLIVTHDRELIRNSSDRIFRFDVKKQSDIETISRVALQ